MYYFEQYYTSVGVPVFLLWTISLYFNIRILQNNMYTTKGWQFYLFHSSQEIFICFWTLWGELTLYIIDRNHILFIIHINNFIEKTYNNLINFRYEILINFLNIMNHTYLFQKGIKMYRTILKWICLKI